MTEKDYSSMSATLLLIVAERLPRRSFDQVVCIEQRWLSQKKKTSTLDDQLAERTRHWSM